MLHEITWLVHLSDKNLTPVTFQAVFKTVEIESDLNRQKFPCFLGAHILLREDRQ